MERSSVDVVVVGAGPAGLLVTSRIKSLEVIVFEEHSKVGLPKHCAGIVGYETAIMIERETSPKVIDHRYNRLVFIAPNCRVDLVFKRDIAFHVNRPLLEEIMALKVESLGHKIVFNNKAYPYSLKRVLVSGGLLEYKYLVVADGARSVFRERLIGDKPKYLVGLQICAKVRNLDEKTLYVFYNNLVPEFFAWIIPLGDEALIGVASLESSRAYRVLQYTQKYLDIPVASVYEKFGGLIPLYNPLRNPVLGDCVVFHGDSVPLTKPYTGGGLHYIFKLSPVLARLLEENRLRDYSALYKRIFYFKNSLERVLVNYLRRLNAYYLPTKIVNWLYSLGLLQEGDFDNQYRIFLKSLGVTPVLTVFAFLDIFKTLHNVFNESINSSRYLARDVNSNI